MTLVIDSSVAVKWFVQEPLSERADELLRGDERLVAPALILVEVANVMWRKMRSSEVTLAQTTEAISEIETTLTLRPLDADMMKSAIEIAAIVRHSIYDCVFLACAVAENAPLVTADARFAERVARGTYHSLLRHLA